MTESIRERMTQAGVRKRLEDEAEQLLEMRNITVGSTKLPHMPPAEGQQKTERIKTNIFKMVIGKPVTIFHYNVQLTLVYKKADGGRGERELTSAQRADVLYILNRELARKFFSLVQETYPHLIPPAGRTYFDGVTQLFSVGRLNDDALKLAIDMNAQMCRVIGDLGHNLQGAEFRFDRSERTNTLGEFLVAATTDLQENQNLASVIQFLEIATSEGALNGSNEVMFRGGACVLANPQQFGFEARKAEELDCGGYIADGCKKTVRAIKTGEKVEFGVVVDPKVFPFHHAAQLLSDKVQKPGALKKADDICKGLFFLAAHRPDDARPKRVHSISKQNAREATFEHEGQTVTVQQYFARRYNIQLEHPELPLVVVQRRGRDEYYPMECCEVCDNQRLAKNLIDQVVQNKLLHRSTRLPAQLQRDVISNLRALGLKDDANLAGAFLKVEENPIEVEGHVFERPTLQYKKSKTSLDLLKGNWTTGMPYIVPATINCWGLYSLTREGESDGNALNLDELRKFGFQFFQECKRRGITMSEPADCRVVKLSDKQKDMKNLVANARNAKATYLLFITDEQDTAIHDIMKYCEQQCQVVTQNVTAKIARQAAGIGQGPKRHTFENIINKTNVKNGGLNYEVLGAAGKNLSPDDLFIGVSANVSGGGRVGELRMPTIVGYAANDLKDTNEYSGNYFIQEPLRDEKVKVIEGIVLTALQRFRKNRGKYPKRVFIIRNSSSEGSFDFVMKYEIPLVRSVLAECDGPRLVFMVMTRQHNVRLSNAVVSGQKPMEQNLKPGTCVDKRITNPYIPEFYMLGHVGRLGTSNVPRYAVLFNEAMIGMEELQKTVLYLCFQHQIVNSPTSVPTPVYVSTEMAKRGRNVYNVASSIDQNVRDSDDFNDLTARYDYAGALRDVRFNA